MATETTPETPHESTGEKIAKSARGEDEPMDSHSPTIPFALVLGSYPIILVVALIALLALFWMFRT